MKTGKEREIILRGITPTKQAAVGNAAIALKVIELELIERQMQTKDANDYYENIYWESLILFLTENVDYVRVIWDTKQYDFDLSIGLDRQFLVGGGVEETISYCKSYGLLEVATYIESMRDEGELSYLPEWTKNKIAYFY
jgi:hypothetical protein